MRRSLALIAALVIAPSTPGQSTQVAATRPATTRTSTLGANAEAGRYYDVNGCRLYVEVYGSGPPLLMLHGNGGSMKAFAKNVPALAGSHRVILVDSRAQGRSIDAPEHPLTFEIMADDFAALLDAMEIASADVVGFSDGGIDALMLAIRHPAKVRRLVATGANVTPDADAFKPGVWERDRARYERERDLPRTTDKERTALKLFLLNFEQPHITPEQLGTIAAPALIVAGDHDLIALPHTVRIFQSLPHANLWIVPDSGHGTLIEHAEEFNRKVEDFLTRPFKDHG